jgi:hypothetical protein
MNDLEVDPLDSPNLNSCVVAGIIGPEVSTDKSLMRFTVAYQKAWPDGGTSTIHIPIVAKPQPWLKPGETVLVKGELQRRQSRGSPQHDGALEVYAYHVEHLCAMSNRTEAVP